MIPKPSGFRLGRIMIVARREFRSTVFTKGFILGAIAFPLALFVVVALIPLLMSDHAVPIQGTIVIADSDGSVAAAAQATFDRMLDDPLSVGGSAQDLLDKDSQPALDDLQSLGDAGTIVNVKVIRVSNTSDLIALRADVQAERLLALAEVPTDLLSADPPVDSVIALLVPSNMSPKSTALFSRTIRDATVVARVEKTGTDLKKARALVRQPKTDAARMTRDGTQASESLELRLFIPGGFMILMWIATFTSANQLCTTTIEEKSSKVIEVLLSALSPTELLAGKIVGQSFVSAIMLATYGSVGIATLAFATMLDVVPLSAMLMFIVWFVLAYFMVASIMAAVGSAVSDLREAQSLIGPAMSVMMIPLLVWLPISENPTGWLATISSFIPPIGPFIMVLRTTGAIEPIPAWQVIGSLIVNFAATFLLIWLAGRVFRIGVLMQGKPPTPLELLRWARAR